MKYFPTATLSGRGVTSKNEQVKQIQVIFFLSESSNVNSLGILDSFSTYPPSPFKHMSHLSTSLWMLDEKKRSRLLRKPLTNSPLHLRISYEANSSHLAFSSSGQKDDSHWMHFTVNSVCIMSSGPQKNEQRRAAPYGKIKATRLQYRYCLSNSLRVFQNTFCYMRYISDFW